MNPINKLLICIGFCVLSAHASASGHNDMQELQPLIHQLADSVPLKIMALSMLLIGLIMGGIKSNPIPVITGILGSVMLNSAPQVLINLSNDVTEPTAIVAKTDTQPLNPKHAKELFAKEKVNPVLNPIPLKKEFKNKEEYQY